ncbi:MAG: GNAT family N-acetyltransferase [Candidatus Nanopelagicales bacterium]
MDEVDVVRDRAASKFRLMHAGRRIGVIEYRQDGNQVTMDHTVVSEKYSGQGLAARLVEAALADVRANGETVVPRCPYVRDFIAKHPEWADLVPAESVAERDAS